MFRAALFLVGGLLGGWLVAAWWSPAPEPATSPTAEPGVARIEPVDSRIAALESALASERERRRELAADVDALEAAIDRLERSSASVAAGWDGVDSGQSARGDAPVDRDGGSFAERVVEFRERRGDDSDARRVQALVDAGFAPDRAEWITRREAELRMASLQAQYEARRSGEPLAASDGDTRATLRAELGDVDYERYLEATGRPTSVGVMNVIAGSPAEQAGLERGDRLVGYGGQRVYDVGDLNALTVEGTPGEPVTVEVERDGRRIQIVIPRGPLGITGGRRFGRGR